MKTNRGVPHLMKPILTSVAAVMAITLNAAEPASPFKSDKEKTSYAIGIDVGNNLKRNSLDLEADQFAAGFKASFTGGKALMTEEQVRETLTVLSKQMQEKAMAKQAEMAAKMKEAGAAAVKEGVDFLEANKKKEGVLVLPSGLQYKVIKAGTGPMPKATDTVKTHYRGTLINGKEFDSSYKRGEPAEFPVGGVIKGWVEALQIMKTGSKWQLFIPANLAYAEAGAGADIPPNSALIFDIELLEIVSK